MNETTQKDFIKKYLENLNLIFDNELMNSVIELNNKIINKVESKRRIFLCGNGGSGANANHIENDFIYGIRSKYFPNGFQIESLNSNNSVLSCLANDEGYDRVFIEQIKAKAIAGDLLICLSGSGNSKNIISVLKESGNIGVETFSILGFDGGEALKLTDSFIHIKSFDMQLVEDTQMMIFHIISRLIKTLDN